MNFTPFAALLCAASTLALAPTSQQTGTQTSQKHPPVEIGPTGRTPDGLPIVMDWVPKGKLGRGTLQQGLQAMGVELNYREVVAGFDKEVADTPDGFSPPFFSSDTRMVLQEIGDTLLLRGPEYLVQRTRKGIEELEARLQPRSEAPVETVDDAQRIIDLQSEIRYLSAKDVERLCSQLAGRAGGQWTVMEGGTLVLSGRRSVVEPALATIRSLDQPPVQGTLRLRVLRLSEAAAKQQPDAIPGLDTELLPAVQALYPGRQVQLANTVTLAFAARQSAGLRVETGWQGNSGAGVQLQLNARVGSYDTQARSIGLNDLHLNLIQSRANDSGVAADRTLESLATDLQLKSGESTVLGSLSGGEYLFVMDLLPG